MSGLRSFILGIVVTLLVLALGGYMAVRGGLVEARADVPPPAIERWAARTSLDATIDRETAALKNPLQDTDENERDGVRLYGANCAVCHGTSDEKSSNIAQGLYIRAPQLAKHGVEDDPEEETYWKIAHGIRFTGMPSYTKSLSDNEMWQLAVFLKHMDSLKPGAASAWKALPSAETPKD
jgi:thiosulfate dehydrogenase